MKAVLVIGGMGQDGSDLARLLLAYSDSVHVAMRCDPATPVTWPQYLNHLKWEFSLYNTEAITRRFPL